MYAVNSPHFRANVASLQSGSTRKRISRGNLATLELPVPPLPEQHRIVAKIEELLTRLDAGVNVLQAVRAQLKRYRQSVLKSAFEGKLTAEWRAAHKDKLEPASVLLERIKKERKKKLGNKYKESSPVDTSELPELPEGWVWTTTSNVCSSVRDGTHETPKYHREGIPLVTSKNLRDGLIDFGTTRNISLEDHDRIKVRSGVDPGDILFAMIGTVGNPVVVRTDRTFSIKNVGLFKKDEKAFVPEFVKYWFDSPLFLKVLQEKYLKGTTQKFVPLENLRALPVAFSCISEQEQIVLEVERSFSVADAIEKSVEQSLAQSDRLRQSILKRAFKGKLVPQDPNDEHAEKMLKRIRRERESNEGEPRTRPRNFSLKGRRK
jgi:type I restriction enzyme S subunit